MEFTREIINKLTANAERAKSLNQDQAVAELRRIGFHVERNAHTGSYSVHVHKPVTRQNAPKREP